MFLEPSEAFRDRRFHHYQRHNYGKLKALRYQKVLHAHHH